MSGYLGAIGGGIGAIGAIGGIFGGEQAANAEKDASNQLLNTAQQMYNTDAANFAPYLNTGTAYANALTSQLPQLSQGFDPTVQQLQNTPGYQFQLQQGLEAAQNGFAAQGLGVSGAAMKGAASYATGLANENYQDLANVYNQNRTTTANILTGGANLGMTAAGNFGQLGMDDLQYQAMGLLGAGNAKAQGDMAPWEGISQAGADIAGASGGFGGGSGGSGGGGSMGSMMDQVSF